MKQSLSIAAQLDRAEIMLAGLASHGQALAKRGIDPEFITQMTSCYHNVIDAHNNKLAFKARQMEKTAECNDFLTQLSGLYSVARKQVKIDLPVETWREFGITDRR